MKIKVKLGGTECEVEVRKIYLESMKCYHLENNFYDISSIGNTLDFAKREFVIYFQEEYKRVFNPELLKKQHKFNELIKEAERYG